MNDNHTVKQIAKYLDVSKTTVQNIINKYNIKPSFIGNRNTRYYDGAAVKAIAEKLTPIQEVPIVLTDDVPTTTEKTAPTTDQKPPISENNSPFSGEKSQKCDNQPTTAEQTILSTIEVLKEQLRVKDQQIAELNRRLEEAHEIQKGYLITSATKGKEIAETVEHTPQQEETPKKGGFWNWFAK